MPKLAAGLAVLLSLGLLSACGAIHGVSTAAATNVQGAPGSAGDSATGGQGNNSPEGDHR